MVLKDYDGNRVPLNLICPHRQLFSPAIRQLYELLKLGYGKLQREYITLRDGAGRQKPAMASPKGREGRPATPGPFKRENSA